MPLAAGSITVEGGIESLTVTQTATPSGGTAPYSYRVGYRTPAGSGGYTYQAVGSTGPWPISGLAAGSYGVILETTDATSAVISTTEVTATVTAATTTMKELVLVHFRPVALLGQAATRFVVLLRRRDAVGTFHNFTGTTLQWCILPAYPRSEPADGDWTTVVPVETVPAVGVANVYAADFIKSGLTRGREYIVWLRYLDGLQDERIRLGYITPEAGLDPSTAAPDDYDPAIDGQWLNGAGAPTNADGQVGNYWLRTSNGAIYYRGSSGWSVIYTPSSGGGGGSSWLANGQLDVDATYRYITGFQADGGWQVNRRHRTTKVVTVATAANNPSYVFTNQSALRAARETLTYG